MTAPLKLTPDMPTNVMVDAINQNFNQVEAESRRKVVTDEDGHQRILIGKKETGDYAVKVSSPGYDVEDATDDQLVMSSDWVMWKIIASGEAYFDPTLCRRSGNLSLTSTNIGYVSDVFIPIINLPDPTKTGFANRLQVFVRDFISKQDLQLSATFFNDGTNKARVLYEYYIYGRYLLIRATVVWDAGTVTCTPRSHALLNINPFWEIANPTRAFEGGKGGGGTPTGKNVYYDSVVYNPYDYALDAFDQSFNHVSLAPESFSSIYSYTWKFFDNATSYRFPLDSQVIPIPAVEVSF